MRKMLSVVAIFSMLLQMSTAAQPLMLQEDAARAETLKQKILKLPLQNFISVRMLNKEKYWGRLIEATDTDCSVRILLPNGIEDRKFPYSQLRSAGEKTPPVPANPYTRTIRERIFQVPEGSQVQVRFRNRENLIGIIDDFRAQHFSLRFRTANQFNVRDINFSDVESISVRSEALSRAISDPAVWDLISSLENDALPEDKEAPLSLKDGTPVPLRLLHAISSADVVNEDRVEFEVAAEIRIGNQIAIPKGSLAWGHVTEAAKRRRMGRGGRVGIALESALLNNGISAPLRAVRQTAGGGNVSGVVVEAVLVTALFGAAFAPLTLLRHGTDTAIPKGTMIVAYINGDIALDGK